jgi:kynureninase
LTRHKIIVSFFLFFKYALTSLIEYNGLDPDVALIQLKPRKGEETLRQEDILQERGGGERN